MIRNLIILIRRTEMKEIRGMYHLRKKKGLEQKVKSLEAQQI